MTVSMMGKKYLLFFILLISSFNYKERTYIECDKICQTLPRAPESSGIILLKLKSKLQFKGYMYYQAVCPEVLLYALNWLVTNNELYKTKSQLP